MELLRDAQFRSLILISLVSSVASSGTKCAAVEFPTLDASLTLTAVENDTIRLPFTIVNASCGGQKKTFVTVKAFTRTNPDPAFLCLLILQNGQCLKEDGCTCDGKDKFILGRKTARSEIGRWVWESSIMATRQIFANITYPAEVRELKLVPSSPVEEYSQLNISCTWEEGNPPVQAQLTHSLKLSLADQTPNGLIPTMTTDNEDNSTTVTHIFNRVYCKDVGFIRCLAPGASSNKTATLLVKCPPSFTDKSNQTFRATDDRVNLTLTIRTHTREVEGCTLTHLTSGKTRDCGSSHSVFGIPPDLVLTVQLDNVSSEDDGGWRLNVSNDAGQGHVDFWITGPDTTVPTTTATTPVTSQRAEKEPGMPPTGAIIGVVVALSLVCAVGLGICTVRKRKQVTARRHLATQRAQIEIHGRLPVEQVDVNRPDNGSRAFLIPQQQHHARQRNELVSGRIVNAGRVKGAVEASGNAGRQPADGGETYVNIGTVKKNKAKDEVAVKADGEPVPSCSSQQDVYVDIKEVQKRKRKSGKDGAANIVKEDLDGNTTGEDKTEEGLMYVQLDFRGRKPRNRTIQPLPRTDYAEVNFQADPAPCLDDE